MEISITVSGFIKTHKPNKFQIGDVLIGIASSGLHSNGFTKVREVFGEKYQPEFVEPTSIYLEATLALDEQFDIHGMMHITGGAYTKLKDLLSDDIDLRMERNHKLTPQQIFKDLYQKGISDGEMYKTFNCGVGFILSVLYEKADGVISRLRVSGFEADIIGGITSGTGRIKIESMFSNQVVEF